MKKIILSLLVLSVAFTGCKKDDPAKTCSLGAAEVVGSYKLTAATYKADAATPAVDVFNNPLFFEACERDNVSTFNANNTFSYTDAGTVCSPSDSYTSTWSLSGSTITVDGDPYTVTSFSCSNMIVSDTNAATGESYVLTFTRQ